MDEFTGELIDSAEGNLEWIPINELTNINLWDGDKLFIPWLFEDNFFSAKFMYENGHYVDHEVNFY
jgi:8-oxo-dGTP diphosphatase